jgi:hypothetical protein
VTSALANRELEGRPLRELADGHQRGGPISLAIASDQRPATPATKTSDQENAANPIELAEKRRRSHRSEPP